ncbi:pyridoxamine 5'-phosphate oxidase family protein [Flindersiella endophytica]
MVDKFASAVIGYEECVRLLSSAQLGRAVFTERALPAVQPVSYVVRDNTIIMSTVAGSRLSTVASDSVIGFEVDEIDPDLHTGWSVTVVGRSTLVRDPVEVSALSSLPLTPWALGRRTQFIRLALELVHGRRIVPPAPATVPLPVPGEPVVCDPA